MAPPVRKLLSEKAAIITGSSSGIGLATAAHFVSLGAYVVITGRSADGLEEARKECLAAGARPTDIEVVQGEITDPKVRKQLIETALAKFGHIDILINNAGICPIHTIADGTANLQMFDKIFDVNVRAVIDLTNLAIPHLLKTKGAIVNISSVGGVNPVPGFSYYCMSKAALDMYTKSLAQELGSKGVRVNGINPGGVRTGLLRSSGIDVPPALQDKFFEEAKARHILNRVGEPKEIAEAMAFLCSDNASFITGINMPVDGGYLIHTPNIHNH